MFRTDLDILVMNNYIIYKKIYLILKIKLSNNLKKINFKYEIIHEDAYEISLEYLKYFKKLKNTKFLITGGGGFY